MKESTKAKIRIYSRTLFQAFFVWILSSLPLLCAAAWQTWLERESEVKLGFWGNFGQNLSAGESFLYISAFVAPFFWVMTSYNNAQKKIGGFAVWLLLSVVTIVASAFLFAAHRAGSNSIASIPYVGIILYFIGFVIWVRSLHADMVLNLPDVEEPHVLVRTSVNKISKRLGGGS